MWLLDATTLELKEFLGEYSIPRYAILSHTWGSTEDEVTFSEMKKHRDVAEQKKGFSKIRNCCLKATQQGIGYAWVDSCCIDKRSSAELSEAINSMFKYYQNAHACYAYLGDVDVATDTIIDADFANSRWFTRGWTLQELIAPEVVYFFARDWTFIGQKCPSWWHLQPFDGLTPKDPAPFRSKLASITGIPVDVLGEVYKVRSKSAAQRMSWASRRETTRAEDSAYSLMGLFDVNMPILYGEGEAKAFQRLQLEIIREVPDQSIFAWRREPGHGGVYSDSGLLAKSPRDFYESSGILISHPTLSTIRPHAMTNVGLFINVRIWHGKDDVGDDRVLASLRCWTQADEDTLDRVRIYLRQIRNVTAVGSDCLMYRRDYCDTLELAAFPSDLGIPQDIYVLEDAQFDHVRLINNLDVFEPEVRRSPGYSPTLKAHYQEL